MNQDFWRGAKKQLFSRKQRSTVSHTLPSFTAHKALQLPVDLFESQHEDKVLEPSNKVHEQGRQEADGGNI